MIILLVHLTSRAIEASLVRLGQAEKTSVFQSRSLPLHNDLKDYIRDAHETLSANKEKIEAVACILGPTYMTGKTKIIPYSSPAPVMVDKNLFDKLKVSHLEGQPIENKIIHTNLNGYPTEKAIGKEATSIEITVYQSAASEEVIDEIRKNILPISKRIFFRTSPYVAYKVLSSFRADRRPFTLIEIERDISTFSLINGNSFFDTLTIGKGTGLIYSEIQNELNLDENSIDAQVKMLGEGTLDEPIKTKLGSIIEKALKKWSEEANKGFSDLSGGLPLPGEMYLIAPDLWSDAFKKMLKENDYSDFTYEKGGFNVDIFDFKDLLQNVSFETVTENPLLTLMDVLFINKYLI